MKLTYGTINNAFPALCKLAKLDVKAAEAVKLARLLGKIETELKPLEEAQRKLFEKYGEKTEDGGYEIKPENREAFSKEGKELFETEIDIDTDRIEIKSDIQIDAATVLALEEIVAFGGE